jgi:hypothetical protein
MGNIPTNDNLRGYPVIGGTPFSIPLSAQSASAYLAVDFNFPLSEFCARIDDDTLNSLIVVANKVYNQSFTLNGIRNTGPISDTLKLFNLVIKTQVGYNRILYNFALPYLNLGALIAKNNGSTQPIPVGLNSPINPLVDNTTTFIHSAVLKAFETMAQEGRNYSEMALQVYSGTEKDGLDWENKYSRLFNFWNQRFSISPKDELRFDNIFNNMGFQMPLRDYAYINVNALGQLNTSSYGPMITWGDPSTPLPDSITLIGYLRSFTQDARLKLIYGTWFDNSILPSKSFAQVIEFMRSIVPGTYSTLANETTLVGSPLVPNPVSYRNFYSLNPTISYNSLLGPFPGPPAPQYPAAITFGDYLIILIWRIMNLSGLPSTGISPGRPSDVVSFFLPTVNRSAANPYTYLDYCTLVNGLSNYITANSLQVIAYPPLNSNSDPNITPPNSTSPPPMTAGPVPDSGFSTMAIFFPGNDFYDSTVYLTTPTPLAWKGIPDIFEDILALFPDIVVILGKIFRITPPLTAVPSFTVTSFGPIPSATINSTTNFYQQAAVRNLWNTGIMADVDFIFDESQDGKSNDLGIVANKVLAFTIFSMVAQEYVNINSTSLSSSSSTYVTIVPNPNPDLSGNQYTISGDLLSIVKITLALLDKLYVYFVDKFSVTNMQAFNNLLISNNPPDSIIQPVPSSQTYTSSALANLLGLASGISQTGPGNITYDPLNYMAYMGFAMLLNYNYDFVRELTQDISLKYLLGTTPSTSGPNIFSQTQLSDLERRVNNLMPVTSFDSNSAFNPFNIYLNNGPHFRT